MAAPIINRPIQGTAPNQFITIEQDQAELQRVVNSLYGTANPEDRERAEDAADRSQAWAESPTPPDPDDATSKSSKTWAGEAANSATAAAASASQADTFATQAELAALAAGAPIVTSLTDPVPADDTVELLKLDAGLQVHEVVTGAWVLRGWLVGPKFDAVALLLASSATTLGPVGQIVEAGGFPYEVLDPSTPIVEKSSSVEVLDGYHLLTEGGVKLRVLPADDGALHSAAFGIIPSSDNTAELQFFMAAITGRRAVIDYASAPYRANLLSLWSGVHLTLLPGVQIIGMGNNSSTIFRTSAGQEDIVLSGYGAYIELPAADRSHALLINRAKGVLVEGLKIKGPGLPNIHESDCIYLGGSPDDNDVCENIVFRDVVAFHARRNILSVVGCHGALFENCDFSETLEGGTFRKVIDFEANRFMADGRHAVRSVTIRKCKIHKSADTGILVSWAEDITIDNCDIWDTVDYGIHITPGGQIFNPARNPRPGDRLGVISIDAATGWITVSSGPKLIDDWGIHPGVYCTRSTRDGGVWPAELTGGFLIEDISEDQLSIRVSMRWGFPITSFSGAGDPGTGSLDEDPDVSALWSGCYRTDDSITLTSNRIWDTLDHCVQIVGQDVIARDNRLTPTTGIQGINVQRSRDVRLEGNRINGHGVGTRGITVSECPGLTTLGNIIKNTTGNGIRASGVSGARLMADQITDCGDESSDGALMFLDFVKRAVIDGAVLRSSAGRPATHGLRLRNNIEKCLITGVDAFSTGEDNAKSIRSGGTGTRIINSIQKDGTWRA